MTRISRSVWFNKWIFPALWFGFLAFFAASAVRRGAARKNPILVIVPAAMGVFGVGFMRRRLWDLADEVHDAGDHLIVRRGRVEATIPLSEILNVYSDVRANPPRLSLRLAEPGVLGREVAFSPAGGSRFNPFGANPLVDDLLLRVDAARSERSSSTRPPRRA